MVRNTRYVLVSLINEDRPGVLKYTHLYDIDFEYACQSLDIVMDAHMPA